MNHRTSTWLAILMMVAVGVALAANLPAIAQEATAVDEAEDAAKPTDKKERAEPRGRLPYYYNRVVNPQQREAIYTIQQQYEVKLEALRQQLKQLVEERDAEIESVLRPEQLEQVKAAARKAAEERLQRAAERVAKRKAEAAKASEEAEEAVEAAVDSE